MGDLPTSTGHTIEPVIEGLREAHSGGDMAAIAVVGAFDTAAKYVKVLRNRTATIEVTCEDGNVVALQDVGQILAVEMLDSLITDQAVTTITLKIAPAEDAD